VSFLIAYDIADPARLRRVARFMERRAHRCQKSVFWFDGTPEALAALLEEARPLLDARADVVQAWRLAGGERPQGQALGAAVDVSPAGLVLAPGQQWSVRRR
jgi:CRISPR-associated protein Cas2